MRCIKKLNRALRRIPGPNASFTITVIPPPRRARPAPHALASLRVCVCGALAALRSPARPPAGPSSLRRPQAASRDPSPVPRDSPVSRGHAPPRVSQPTLTPSPPKREVGWVSGIAADPLQDPRRHFVLCGNLSAASHLKTQRSIHAPGVERGDGNV